MKKRIFAIDAAKALGVILMGIAHTPSWNETSLVRLLIFIGGLAPAFYFSAAGYLVSNKKSKRYYVLFGLALFFFGLFYQGINDNLLVGLKFNIQILQIIGLGLIFTRLLDGKLHQAVSYLIPFTNIFVKRLTLVIVGGFESSGWLGLFTFGKSIAGEKLLRTQFFIPFFLMMFTMLFSNIRLKGSLSYIFMNMVVFVIAYIFFESFEKKFSDKAKRLIQTIAELSLPFLFVNMIFVKFFFWPLYQLVLEVFRLPWYFRFSSFLMIIGSTIGSIILAMLLQRFNNRFLQKITLSPFFWILAATVLTLGFFTNALLFKIIFLIFGLIFAFNLQSLSKLIAQLSDRNSNRK